ncbi:MAG: hypothetical protein R3Y58_11535 [Eubacteriales bacterium]
MRRKEPPLRRFSSCCLLLLTIESMVLLAGHKIYSMVVEGKGE